MTPKQPFLLLIRILPRAHEIMRDLAVLSAGFTRVMRAVQADACSKLTFENFGKRCITALTAATARGVGKPGRISTTG